MADTATLEARLEEAEEALHQVLIGQSVTVTAYDGHRTEYGPAKEGELRRYIGSLKRELGRGRGPGSRRVVF
ncbi:hypothetical protein GCM10011415_02220 [Salipiger pallidus]|uniref:GpW protein n=1 Tax=Salipiger pallidus TaxID=1775170 RepID=A0A8J2ZGA4_9RHOB|nr:gpW family head-tail joining protein [Salipiger pallidus]GGG59822.1 hypothetical protein GCM10011415_02220 [Salipiger pallidus]